MLSQFSGVAAALLFLPTVASGEALISEIMYDPASSEAYPNTVEWVEVYNAGDEAVQLTGWYLQDEDGETEAISREVSIEAKSAIVLIPGRQSAEAFREAWGEGIEVVRLENWGRGGIRGLANSPSEGNERLTLRDGDGRVVEAVNFQGGDPWPGASDGPSIYVQREHLTPEGNDEGQHWQASQPGQTGAHQGRKTSAYSPDDVGSPGKVVDGSDAGQ